MAALRWALSFVILLSVALIVGCQTKPMSARLPAPTFDGPRIVAGGSTRSTGPIASRQTGPSDWSPRAPARQWKWIVIHHSASPTGSMIAFDKEHRAKGWDGVGYHFVIGNGTGSGDGQIEVTPRWPIQKWGAHAKTLDNRYNEYGIGICLVGNCDITQPTPAQLQSLNRLVAYLMQTYRVPTRNVIGHRDTKATACPGRYVNVPAIRTRASQTIARANGRIEPDRAQTASAELLADSPR